MNNYKKMYSFEKSYITKVVSENEINQTYTLRHKVFAEELKWIKSTSSRLDIDQYDQGSVSIGVFDSKNKLCGCFRIISHKKPFMVESDFRLLIGNKHILRKMSDTIEISRFCIDVDSRHDNVKFPLATSKTSLLLYKGMYQWCCLNKVRFSYAVVETKFLRRLNLTCLPFKPVDAPKLMPDGTEAVAVIIDWREFEAVNMKRKKILLTWFNDWENSCFFNQALSEAFVEQSLSSLRINSYYRPAKSNISYMNN